MPPCPVEKGCSSGFSKFASKFFSDRKTVEQLFHELAKILEDQDRRFLFIIDDIDRLSPDEALAIFRLVKSVGRLPNVMYLLVFDRQLAEAAVLKQFPSEGPHFLEKIIQAGFELPYPLQVDLNNAVLASVDDICGGPDESQIVRTMNIFYDVVAPYITTPRHVTRYQNAINLSWPGIAKEVNLADFLALEIIRLYEPELFRAIRARKSELCGIRQDRDPENRSITRFDRFVHDVSEARRGTATLALQRLFPRLEEIGYGHEWIQEWDADRRVCVEPHFDTYFRLALSEEALSARVIDELIGRANDREFVQSELRKAAAAERKNKQSFVPVYLDELTSHAKRIEKGKVEAFLCALFEIHDEIDLEEDAQKGFMSRATTTLRYHWLIRRITKDRFSLSERTELYLRVIQTASFGWLLDFVRSARAAYAEREGRLPRPEDDCLVSREAIEPLTQRALDAIRSAAISGSLLSRRELGYFLYLWRELAGHDPTEVRAWTDGLMNKDDALVVLAQAFTSESWSMGIGGFGSLGDRIAKPSINAQIEDTTGVLDTAAFRAGLERILREGKLQPKSLRLIEEFVRAWDAKQQGHTVSEEEV